MDTESSANAHVQTPKWPQTCRNHNYSQTFWFHLPQKGFWADEKTSADSEMERGG